jgi:hypothetical protein
VEDVVREDGEDRDAAQPVEFGPVAEAEAPCVVVRGARFVGRAGGGVGRARRRVRQAWGQDDFVAADYGFL